jgi:predicted enzyme related to lactoylglutathione lyase
MNMKFVHTNIISRNWKNLAQFYIEVFECIPVPPERKQSGEWLEKGTGLKGADLEGIHLRLPGYGDDGPTLEIHQYKESIKDKAPEVNRTGIRHLAFSVPDVRKALALALLKGGKALGEITTKIIPEVGEITFVYTTDPEGNIIEIQS